MKLRTKQTLALAALFFVQALFNPGCADRDFMDKTKKDGAILKGEAVTQTDPLKNRAVIIVKNFKVTSNEPYKFDFFGFCSGVIIGSHYVLTAGHCATDYQKSRVILTTDIHAQLTSATVYTISEPVVNPAYLMQKSSELSAHQLPGPDDLSNSFDLAILKLDRDIVDGNFDKTYFSSPSAVTYFSQNTSAASTTLLAMGYGRTTDLNTIESTDPINGVLEKAKFEIPQGDLAKKIITYDQLNKAGVCIGDSGGPVFVRRDAQIYLQFLSIAVYKDKSTDPLNKHDQCYGKSLFLNLDLYKEWIKQTISE